MEKVFANKVISQILEKYKIIWALNYASDLANWDLSTYMPEDGAIAKGEALAKMNSLRQSLFLDKEFVNLIKQAEKEKSLNDSEKGIVRMLERSLKRYEKLPPEFLEEFSRTVSQSHGIWIKAKKENNFSLFAPCLEKIVDLALRQSEYMGYKKHPYDALLDDYEEHLLASEVEIYFDSIRDFLIDLLGYIKKSPKYLSEHGLEKERYNKGKMERLNLEILRFFNADSKKLRLDASVHPFTQYIGPSDARITTRYHETDFGRSMFATIHEFGHALYDLNCNPGLSYTPVDRGSSLIIHESQSRFWENAIGRSKEFAEKFYGEIIALDPGMNKYSLEDIYLYFNSVKPSLIRVEADEVTYHFHIMIRFEIEKALLEKSIKVKDLPEIWNEKYKKYLGIMPKYASEGVLQDVHWSLGNIGYFPTYSPGTALSAQWKFYLEKDLGSIDMLIKEDGGIGKIQDWLKNKIHQYGSTYTYKDLVKKTTGEEFTAKYFKDYLAEKYKKIY